MSKNTISAVFLCALFFQMSSVTANPFEFSDLMTGVTMPILGGAIVAGSAFIASRCYLVGCGWIPCPESTARISLAGQADMQRRWIKEQRDLSMALLCYGVSLATSFLVVDWMNDNY